ncbi:hypothetical protein M514_06684 [Trichuris suis]|uniref:Uncharacterized protein n=1 Tax=Trichuris suis TaxID=68888 RepID=A0A085M5J1_9BILA|nr:hypothetical protein M513_06684 [Trichuris suis]KFD68977.1 hypothetical protein M514_06684 [Trichuris suis]
MSKEEILKFKLNNSGFCQKLLVDDWLDGILMNFHSIRVMISITVHLSSNDRFHPVSIDNVSHSCLSITELQAMAETLCDPAEMHPGMYSMTREMQAQPTSWQIALISAPVTLSGRDTKSSKSTSSCKFILDAMVVNTRRFCLRSGNGNSIFRSNRPGRSNAGSNVSALFVAIIT